MPHTIPASNLIRQLWRCGRAGVTVEIAMTILQLRSVAFIPELLAIWRFAPGMVGADHEFRMAIAGPVVLVADDSADARDLYKEYLETCGFRVVTAEDGVAAVDTAKQEWPAAIIMDLAMPRMDGWEAIRRLRADPLTADIPIVAVSAYAFGREPVAAREAGADLCLSKPCLPPQVVRVVRAMIAARQ